MAFADLFKSLRRGRKKTEPVRDTTPFPNLMQIGQQRTKQLQYKPTPRNLRYFGRTVYGRRAINAIKNPIAGLEWEIVPIKGVDLNPELERQIEIATRCFQSPNQDDSFRTMTEQVIEDYLHGAGAVEVQIGADPLRPLWFYPTDGLSIQIYPGWTGDANEARYAQSVGYASYTGGGPEVLLRNDELIYIRPNPSTATPFGLGPLEVAFTSISRILGVGAFAGDLSSNSTPSYLIDLGEGVTVDAMQAFRAYWTNEIEGQGKIPINAMKGGKVHQLYPQGDDALYLKFQEFLKSEIAVAFDLSPQNLGVERDVNRSTSEVAEDRDWDQAITPHAQNYAEYLTREALHRKLGFWSLMFRFVGLEREDEQAAAEVYQTYYKNNAITPDEQRAKLGQPPMADKWGQLTYAEMMIAVAAAKSGPAQGDDPEPQTKPKPKSGRSGKDAPKPEVSPK